MVEVEVTVTNRLGLHARAAAKVVRAANLYKSSVKLHNIAANKYADARSILDMLTLGAAMGTSLNITADGEDETTAIDTISRLFLDGFDED